MGKDLKGKELGTGISQRKDGLYTARFTDRNGRRRQQYFKKLQECRKWLADAQFDDEHGNICACGDMTVDAWFDYWIGHIIMSSVKEGTICSYKIQYRLHIAPYIGKMSLQSVKPMHCQNIINRMADSGYKNATIKLACTVMKQFFEGAVENEMIAGNPVKKSVRCAQGKAAKAKTALTVEEQKAFLRCARKSSYYFQYALVLQTGIRVGELTGLKWQDIDFEKRTLHILRTVSRRSGTWTEGTPKSHAGERDIPLTGEAVAILENIKKRSSGNVRQIQYHDLVFTTKARAPIGNAEYYHSLRKICKDAEIPPVSMHILRHTFATRCIEGGMKPKVLQEILGHSSVNTTMDIYVHVTEDGKNEEMALAESALKVI